MERIEWKNHIVAFLSALFGIIIAFQLEDYRETSEQKDRLDKAYQLVISEIESNISIYQNNVTNINDFLAYHQSIFELAKGRIDTSIITLDTYHSITSDTTKNYRFANYNVQIRNESVYITRKPEVHNFDDFYSDVLPKTGISTSAWESSINSGVFSQLSQSDFNNLTKIYNWINNRLGRNVNAFFEYGINIDERGNEREYDNIEIMLKNYKVISKVQAFKLGRILPIYEEVKKQSE